MFLILDKSGRVKISERKTKKEGLGNKKQYNQQNAHFATWKREKFGKDIKITCIFHNLAFYTPFPFDPVQLRVDLIKNFH